MADKPEIIIIRTTRSEMLKRLAFSFSAAIVMIGVGVVLESSAMQWTGAALFFLMCFVMSARLQNDRDRLTIPQARTRLDELEAGQ